MTTPSQAYLIISIKELNALAKSIRATRKLKTGKCKNSACASLAISVKEVDGQNQASITAVNHLV